MIFFFTNPPFENYHESPRLELQPLPKDPTQHHTREGSIHVGDASSRWEETVHRLVGAPEMSLRSWAEAPAPLQAPRLSGPRSASSPHLLTPAYTMVPPNRPQLLIGCAFLRGQAGEAGAQLLW